jgi:predicted nicotinamide N-methyase
MDFRMPAGNRTPCCSTGATCQQAIPAFDVVAASDVLYERTLGALVARTIAMTLAENGRALISDPGRVGSPAFFDALHDVGLKHIGAVVVSVSMHGRDNAVTVHEISH